MPNCKNPRWGEKSPAKDRGRRMPRPVGKKKKKGGSSRKKGPVLQGCGSGPAAQVRSSGSPALGKVNAATLRGGGEPVKEKERLARKASVTSVRLGGTLTRRAIARNRRKEGCASARFPLLVQARRPRGRKNTSKGGGAGGGAPVGKKNQGQDPLGCTRKKKRSRKTFMNANW